MMGIRPRIKTRRVFAWRIRVFGQYSECALYRVFFCVLAYQIAARSKCDVANIRIKSKPGHFLVVLCGHETLSRAEKSQMIEQITVASAVATNKFLMYFGQTGTHPSLKFIYDVQYSHPAKSLSFCWKPDLSIPAFDNVSTAELLLYRDRARIFADMGSVAGGRRIESLNEGLQSVRDFWSANGAELPVLRQFCGHYGFLVESSAAAGRTFTYYNKLLGDERRSLDEKNLEKLMFLNFNSKKTWIKKHSQVTHFFPCFNAEIRVFSVILR